jgi:tripartite-type tricarboxylate transporter receptor subunit TctC
MDAEREGRSGWRVLLKFLGTGMAGVLLAVLFAGIDSRMASAEDVYPAKKITWINPTKAAGGSDLVARLISSYMGKYLKEVSKGARGGDVMVRNVPEAGGRKAYSLIFNSKPDGYTIGDFNNAFVTESIISKVEFDYNKYTFIARTGVNLHLLLARKDGVKNWDEMMAQGKKKELKLGTSNFGRSSHVNCILLKETAKVPGRIINFPGAAEAVTALIRGDVNILVTSESSTKALINDGTFRVLAVLAEKSEYPGVPSIADLGFPQLTGPLGQQRLLVGPPGLSPEITDTLTAALKKVFADKEFLAQSRKMEFDPDPVYGAEAQREAQKVFKYYDEMTPVLKRYLE